MPLPTSWLENVKSFCRTGFKTMADFFKNAWLNCSHFVKSHPLLGGGVVISVTLILIVVAGFLWNLNPPQFGTKQNGIFKIRYGSSLREVSRDLKSEGYIRNRLVYEWYVRLHPRGRMAKAGWYRLSPGMSVSQIVKILQRGTPQEISLTVPEGLTVKEIAALLGEKGLVNPQSFLARLQDRQFLTGILGDMAPTTLDNNFPEGYLFPDTYNLVLPVTEKEIITVMLNRFREVFHQNFGTLSPAKRRQILIVASLVEKEAKHDVERPIIAAVFYNRLRIGYPLQSCATVQYALGTRKKRLYDKDLQVNSTFNTYLHYGLPPGPIANPGLASLKAAADPAQVGYLYFVAKPDGSHVFSRTYREHLNAQHGIENGRTISFQ